MLQSVLGILGSVRAQQHADHVITLTLGRALDDVPRKLAYVVKIGAKSAVLASWDVPHEAEQEFRDVSPGRLEYEVQWGGIERRVDAGCRVLLPVTTQKSSRRGRTWKTHNKFAYVFVSSVPALSS